MRILGIQVESVKIPGLKDLPGNWDWIPNNLGTMGTNDPDLIRQRNSQADGLLMVLPELLGGLSKASRAKALPKAGNATTLSVSSADGCC